MNDEPKSRLDQAWEEWDRAGRRLERALLIVAALMVTSFVVSLVALILR